MNMIRVELLEVGKHGAKNFYDFHFLAIFKDDCILIFEIDQFSELARLRVKFIGIV